jgi:hypothetical protein
LTPARVALLAALLLTVLNAAKPLVIDDPAYVAFARQARAHPGDPYGFDLYWYERPEPAIRYSIPAVFPYWLGAALACFGERPVAWKLSLFPFALALTGSLGFLLRRFAPGAPAWLLFPIALGPLVLPSFNLMLDVPTLALSLLAYALFVRACEGPGVRLALVSGLVLGLALHSKLSAVIYAPLFLAHALLFRRLRLGVLALAVAALLFLGWEALLFARYGEVHLFAAVERQREYDLLPGVTREEARAPGTAAVYWTLCLVSLLGGTLPFPAALALVGLGARRSVLAAAALVASAGFAGIAVLPRTPLFAAEGFFTDLVAHNPELLLFLPLGLLTAGALGAAAWRLRGAPETDSRASRLLSVWLLLEVFGWFAIAPFPAARRAIGLGAAAALLGARSASLRGEDRDARAGMGIAAALGLLLGALYFGSDLADATARRDLALRAADRLVQLGADPSRETFWYAGHWELQYYAERAGMRAVVAGVSHLRARDWLVLPRGGALPPIHFPSSHFRQEDELTASSRSPWSTIPLYYDGPVPLRRRPEQPPALLLFRVKRDLVPQLEPADPARKGSSAQRPFQTGGRLSRKARAASAASSLRRSGRPISS